MARYIDAEALTDYMLERYSDLCEKYGDYDHYTTGYGDAIDVIEVAPAADVVPKSEYDELSGKYEDLKLKYAELQKDKNELFAWGNDKKTEVALDVIRKVKNKVRKYKHNVVNPYEHIILYLNELEKKYTEGK